jgi:O-antigen ligase
MTKYPSKRSDLLPRAALAIFGTYALFGGTTSSGMIDPRYRFVTLGLIAVLVIGWLFSRRDRLGLGAWYRTPLDGAILILFGAIAASTLANPDGSRRSMIGVWYALAYAGVWFGMHDLLANRRLRIDSTITTLLLTSIVPIGFGLIQLNALLQNAAAGKITGLDNLPRLWGSLDISTIFAAFLVMMLPLAASQWANVRRGRIVWLVYIGIAGVLLLLTLGRGAWIAAGVAFAVWGVLMLAHFNMLSAKAIRAWWAACSQSQRRIVIVVGIGAVVVALVAAGLAIRLLSVQGRGAEFRSYIYDGAIQSISSKPLLGSGLFTFGRELMYHASVPPWIPQSHAHNAILNIAAELGIIGLIAVAFTFALIVRAVWRNWRTSAGKHRVLLAGVIAALVGLGVQHLTDIPTTTATIALIAVILLCLATAPNNPVPVESWRKRQGFALAGLWSALLISGFLSSTAYAAYTNAMEYAVATEDYRGAADRIRVVAEQDPSLAIYRFTQAHFLSKLAAQGDLAAAQEAIEAYHEFVETEPHYAPAWVNLAMLESQVGNEREALHALRYAADLADLSGVVWVNLGLAEERAGNIAAGRFAYQRAERVGGIVVDPLDPYMLVIAHGQYLRVGAPQYLIDQVFMPRDPVTWIAAKLRSLRTI